jgi:hypothetical protein
MEAKIVRFDNFVKFGGGDAMHHNCAMSEECISISITSYFLANAHLPCP